ncbi:hypothetical protein [Fodinicola feengrottensis]|uniref:hypothetical protein n=1 Tax=Fodinicola feengrottensis TaxID=435914 RepID=UPI0024432660|nr:hypothetical protein [Fodinicola feengrottensis]
MTSLSDELRREFGQLADDVSSRLALSQRNGDQRAADFFNGQAAAFRLTLDRLRELDNHGRR